MPDARTVWRKSAPAALGGLALGALALGALALGWPAEERTDLPAGGARTFFPSSGSPHHIPAPRLRAADPVTNAGTPETSGTIAGDLPVTAPPPPLPAIPPAPARSSAPSAAGPEHAAPAMPAAGRFLALSDAAVGELARGADQPAQRVELLDELGRRRAGLLTLLAFVDDHDGAVRAAATVALRRLGDARAVDRLRDRLVPERDPKVRAELEKALEVLARVAVSPH
jgi:hypothetical protein